MNTARCCLLPTLNANLLHYGWKCHLKILLFALETKELEFMVSLGDPCASPFRFDRRVAVWSHTHHVNVGCMRPNIALLIRKNNKLFLRHSVESKYMANGFRPSRTQINFN